MREPTQDEINRIIEVILGQPSIKAEDLLIQGYGAESIDIANIVTAIEEHYQVHISESSLAALQRPRDFFDALQQARR